MSSVRAASPTKRQPLLVVVGFLCLSTVEIGLMLLYYLLHYAAAGWYAHPTTSGIGILSGLTLLGLVCGYLCIRYWTNSGEAKALSNALSQRNLSSFLLTLVFIATVGFVAFVFNAFPGMTRLYQLSHKHPLLPALIILIGLQGIITLILIRLKREQLLAGGTAGNLLGSIQQGMLRFRQYYWIHLLVWCALLLYLIFGPVIYTSFILKSGKPVNLAIALPPSTDQVKYGIDALETIKMSGQEVYSLWGWSFYSGNPDLAAYDRYVVLRSEFKTYYFAVDSVLRPDVQQAYAGLNQNLMNSGFTGLISKDVVRPGRYNIGILFQPKAGGTLYYFATPDSLIRTPNTLQLARP